MLSSTPNAAGAGTVPDEKVPSLASLATEQLISGDESQWGLSISRGAPGYSPSSSGYTTPSDQMRSLMHTPIHSVVPEWDNHIRVVVRVRPLSERELSTGGRSAVVCIGDGRTVQVGVPGTKNVKSFSFNKCLDPSADQDAVFNQSGIKHLVSSVLYGYAACVFAFGQTGSGKTYTMTGPEDRDEVTGNLGGLAGVVPRAIYYLFDEMAKTPHVRYIVKASFIEIYNEQVCDLLNPEGGKNLPVRWSESRGFYAENVYVLECFNVEEMIAILREGLQNRRVGAHELNKDSSRSHSLLIIYVDSETVDPETGITTTRYGKVSFVDLAGSERVKESKSTGQMLLETKNINKSLFTLGKVISALGDLRGKRASNRGAHIPYRDSVLTKLLMDSLFGNALTLMVACCSPDASNLEETLKTLRYACQVKNIESKPVVRMDPQRQFIMMLQKEVRQLRAENQQLREIVSEFAGSGGAKLPVISPGRLGATLGSSLASPSLRSSVAPADVKLPTIRSPAHRRGSTPPPVRSAVVNGEQEQSAPNGSPKINTRASSTPPEQRPSKIPRLSGNIRGLGYAARAQAATKSFSQDDSEITYSGHATKAAAARSKSAPSSPASEPAVSHETKPAAEKRSRGGSYARISAARREKIVRELDGPVSHEKLMQRIAGLEKVMETLLIENDNLKTQIGKVQSRGGDDLLEKLQSMMRSVANKDGDVMVGSKARRMSGESTGSPKDSEAKEFREAFAKFWTQLQQSKEKKLSR